MPALSDDLKVVGIKTVTFADNPKKAKRQLQDQCY